MMAKRISSSFEQASMLNLDYRSRGCKQSCGQGACWIRSGAVSCP